MRAKHTLLSLLMCCILSSAAFAQTHSVSKAEALTIAQRQFQGRDVDYFILQDNSQTAWTIFVDAEPMKGWEHECYVLTVPKNITTSVNAAVPSSKVERKLPPSGNFAPLSVKNRYGTNANKDNVGNNIGTGSSITVSPVTDNTKYTVIATNEEGEVAEESISLDAVTGIKSVSSEIGYIKVSLRGEASDNSRITISSAVNGTVVASGSFMKGESEITINVPNRDSGVYIVTYLVDDTVVDSRKITVVE